jgi:PKD repeat protein
LRTERSHAGGRAWSRRLATAVFGAGLFVVLLAVSPGVALADLPPTASFVVSANYGATYPVQFDATTSNDPDGTIVAYTWDFGDESPEGSGMAPAHKYALGEYTVKLTVEDDEGMKAMAEAKVDVKESQTITFTSPPPSEAVVGGASYTVTAEAIPSGLPVSFSSGTPSVCTVAVQTVEFVGAGTCTLDADQAGDGEFARAVPKRQSFAVAKGSQSITFTSAAPGGAVFGGPPYTAAAQASSGLPVSLSSATPAVCSVSGSTVTFGGVGTCAVVAAQAGDQNYEAAPSVQLSFAVGRGSQTINFTSTPPGAPVVGGSGYTVQATASSGLPVSFSSGTPAVCAVSDSSVRFIGPGTCTILANQGGSQDYDAAVQAAQSFAVSAAHAPLPNSSFAGHASYNMKTGAITVNVTVGNPGRFTWRATFANGKFGAFAAVRSRCRAGRLRLNGKCLPSMITFGKGATVVSRAGPVTFVVKPSRSASRALRSRAGRKSGVPVSLSISYQSSLGGASVSHTASLTVKIKR